jgi:hypothetical protein
MRDDIEHELKRALRPVAPNEDLVQGILAQLAAKRSRGRTFLAAFAGWSSVALAASLLLAIGIEHRLEVDRETAAGLQARREVIQALKVTHQKLDLAYQAVKEQQDPLAPGA